MSYSFVIALNSQPCCHIVVPFIRCLRNAEVRWTTVQPRLSAIVQARRLSLFGHIVRMPDETDTRSIITASPLRELEETTRTSSNYVDEDYPARPEIKQSLPGWGDNCGSESSTLETDVCVWCYTKHTPSGACHTRKRRIETCLILQLD